MKAILLCAGKGLRLRPYTNNIPKCLMPIKGKPLLEIWLEKLFSAGITNILINAHYFLFSMKISVADPLIVQRYHTYS